MRVQDGMCTRRGGPDLPRDPLAAVDFLERQACGLRQALVRPRDPAVIRGVIVSQEIAHESWLALTGALQRSGYEEAAEGVAALYGLHGRVAARLERGLDPRLEEAVEARLRACLLGELQRRTTQVCDQLLETLPAAPSRAPLAPA